MATYTFTTVTGKNPTFSNGYSTYSKPISSYSTTVSGGTLIFGLGKDKWDLFPAIDTIIVDATTYAPGSDINTVFASINSLFPKANSSAGGTGITLTTTGTSGVATLATGVLNIPNYTNTASSFPTGQVYTTGATLTVTSQTTNIWLIVNPASTVASLNITFPASPLDGQLLDISFGGTLTTGTVVTSLTLTPNTSQTIVQSTTPSSVVAGEIISYRFKSSLSIWYRVN